MIAIIPQFFIKSFFIKSNTNFVNLNIKINENEFLPILDERQEVFSGIVLDVWDFDVELVVGFEEISRYLFGPHDGGIFSEK